MMQIGVFAKTFPGKQPAKVLAASKAAGFSAAQYNMSCSGLASLPSSIPSQAAQEIKDAATSHAVQIAAISATYNMTDPDMDRRKSGRLAFKAIAERAVQMGTNLLTVCSGSLDPIDQWRPHPHNDDPETWLEMCREFELILSHAAAHDLFVGVEPEHANVVSSAKKAKRLLNEFSGSNIRIVFDPANILVGIPSDRQHKIVDEALDTLGSEIVLAHAKDVTTNGEFVRAGAGIIDWQHVLAGLSQLGFDGPVIAHGISASDAPLVAAFLKQQIENQ